MQSANLRVVDIVGTDDSKKFDPAGRMAIAIIEVTQINGGCMPQDLNERGFTPTEVAEHWHLAKSFADVELKMMSRNPAKPKNILRRL